MKVSSISFESMQEMQPDFSLNGSNVNPELEISCIPENTKSLAIAMEDPDSALGTCVHWLVWDILVSSETMKIQKNSKIGVQGKNDFCRVGYTGPCQAKSEKHHYFFNAYALDNIPELKKGSSKDSFFSTIQSHIIEKAVLVGIY